MATSSSFMVDHGLPFEDVVERAMEIIAGAVAGDWHSLRLLDELPDAIYLKNSERIIVETNEAFRRYFSPSYSPIGRNAISFLDKSILDVSEHTDLLILNGSTHLDCEHTARCGDGILYLLQTHKRTLAPLGNPGLSILGVTRTVSVIEEDEAHPRVHLAGQHLRFRSLDETDREICRLLGRGKKVREIADKLSLTSRAVEQRKRKLLEHFDLDQTIELVKLLVRLQDGGFIDLGL